jgi:HK97 family phage major capsid protein/HK97 family phage prohead protease
MLPIKIEDADNRTISLAFSSDAEVRRYGCFIEVLDHSPGACDLSRLNNGANILFNHDLDKYLGVVESASIDADGFGRALARFSKSERGNEVWNDVQDGILRSVSVGYKIHEIKLIETRENGDDVYLVTKWEAYEISIVTAPADITVGVGRSLSIVPQSINPNMKDQLFAACKKRSITTTGNETEDELLALLSRPDAPAGQRSDTPPSGVTVTVDNSPSALKERTRAAEIFTLGKRLKLDDLAQRHIADGKSADEFRSAALEAVTARGNEYRESHTPIGLSDKEARSFSFLNLVRYLCEPADKGNREAAAFEREVTEAAATHRKQARGTVIPVDVLRAPLMEQRDVLSVGAGSGLTGTGDKTVKTTLLAQSYFELLRNKTSIMRLGTILGGLVGNIDIPKQLTNAANAGWIGENGSAPNRAMTFDHISLAPKTVAARGAITRRMLAQSSLDVEALFRMDLAKSMGQAIDVAGYYGDGTGETPLGIRHTDGINFTYFAGVNPTLAELVDMETQVLLANIDPSSSRYVHGARMKGYFKTTRKISTSTDSNVLWEGGKEGGVNGYSSEITNQIETGHLFFGDFSELIIGMWGGLDIIVDPYTQSDKGQVIINNFQDLDFEVRRAAAFGFGVITSGSGS